MDTWRKQLKVDPLPALLATNNPALEYYARRDLLGEAVGLPQALRQLPAAQRLLRRQLSTGAWPRPGAAQHPAINYALIETWRQFRTLVAQYGFTRAHPQAERAAEFLFACQTPAGDFRGFLANQYAPYYTGAILALLIQAGYADDPRVEQGFQWLLAMRQADQGWAIPLLTHKLDRATQYRLTSEWADPLEPNRTQPSSHNWTGMVLRALAAHPRYRRSPAAQAAAQLLVSRFFQPDAYASYRAASYWVRFDYPFWWNNLVAALDSVSQIGLPATDVHIAQALNWLRDHQAATGLWKVSYAQPHAPDKVTAKARETQLWVSLAICRVFHRLLG